MSQVILKDTKKYSRIVAHTDFDGLIAALLLRDILDVETVVFSEPWLIQKGEEDIREGDVIVDLPYDTRCTLWIDHHKSNKEDADRLKASGGVNAEKVIFDYTKKSCPGLIYEVFCEQFDWLNKPDIQDMILAAEKIDSASFTREDIRNPDVWGKISMSLRSDDKRKDDEFRQYLLNILSFMDPEKILEQPVVKKRVEEKLAELDKWEKNMPRFITYDKDRRIIIADTSDVPESEDIGRAPPFRLYLFHPEARFSASIGAIKDDPDTLKVSVGKNIFSDEPVPDIGALMKARGGGGHAVVGGCSVARADKEEFLKQLLEDLS